MGVDSKLKVKRKKVFTVWEVVEIVEKSLSPFLKQYLEIPGRRLAKLNFDISHYGLISCYFNGKNYERQLSICFDNKDNIGEIYFSLGQNEESVLILETIGQSFLNHVESFQDVQIDKNDCDETGWEDLKVVLNFGKNKLEI